MTKTRASLLVAGAGGIALAVLALSGRGGSPQPAPRAVASGPLLRPHLRVVPQDRELVYQLRYREDTRATFLNAPLAGSLDADVTLIYRRRGDAANGRTLIGVAVEAADIRDFSVNGKRHLASADDIRTTLLGREALLDVDGQGRVHAIRHAPGVPPLFQSVVRAFAAETQVVVGDGERWIVQETTGRGTSVNAYSRTDHDGGSQLDKVRTRYATFDATGRPLDGVDGHFTAELDRDGQLVSLRGSERVSLDAEAIAYAATVEVDLQRRSSRNLSADLDIAGWAALPLGATAVTAETQRLLLESAADGLTREEMLDSLGDAIDGNVADHNRFVNRAVALLRLHPELNDELLAMAVKADATSLQRMLIADLFTAAGGPESQAALRSALSDDGIRGDRIYSTMFQRMGLLEAPDRATTDFVVERFDAARSDDRAAAGHTLGAIAATVDTSTAEGAELARQIDRRLVDDLRQSQTPAQVGDALAALGNAGRADNVPAIVGYASHQDASVRRHVANALRKSQTPQAEATLLALAADNSAVVQATSLEALGGYRLGASQLGALRDLATRGAVASPAVPALVRVAIANRGADAATTDAMLRAVVDQGIDDPYLRASIQGVLAGMPVGI